MNKRILPKEIKAVFFDAGGTLFRPYPSVGEIYGRVASKYGCRASSDEINESFHNVWCEKDNIGNLESYSDEKIEKKWWKTIVFDVFKNIGEIKRFDDFFEELYQLFTGTSVWRLYPEVKDVLKELKKRGVLLGIISNWDSRLLKLCEDLELKEYFEFILISAVFGVAKPNPKIFEEGLKKVGVLASETVYVGDSLEDDVGGAGRAKIRALWLDRSGRDKKLMGSQVTEFEIIKNLSEIL